MVPLSAGEGKKRFRLKISDLFVTQITFQKMVKVIFFFGLIGCWFDHHRAQEKINRFSDERDAARVLCFLKNLRI